MNIKLKDSNDHTVFIIDDDPHLCDALRHLFESINLKVETYLDAQSFLNNYNSNKKDVSLLTFACQG